MFHFYSHLKLYYFSLLKISSTATPQQVRLSEIQFFLVLSKVEIFEEAPTVFVQCWAVQSFIFTSLPAWLTSEGSLMPCWASAVAKGGGAAVARAPGTSVWVQPLPCPTKPHPSDVCYPHSQPGHNQPGSVGPWGTGDTQTSSPLLMLKTLLVLTSTFWRPSSWTIH